MISQLRKMDEELKVDSPDIMEMFSPPRVTQVGKGMGLEAGEAMDLITGWDFSREEDRKRAWRYIKVEKPKLIIGSPPCTMFSALQYMHKETPERVERLAEAKRHMEFMTEVYEHQLARGWWFLHEHPHSAASWRLKGVWEMCLKPGVQVTVADQCMYGLKTEGAKGQSPQPARKRTRFMTNCPGVAEELQRRCDGGHARQELLGKNRAGKAAEYPEELCRAICRGLVNELKPKPLRK